jgi:outer membrane protein assembly factor BamE (lipoprotein component of BamABCDE complex)
MRKMGRPVACALSLCLALSASGCFSGQEYAAESGALIQPGMSMEEVHYQLGDPDLVVRGDPGTDTEWVYRYDSGATPVVWALLVVFAVVLIVVLVAASAKGGGGSFGGGWGGGSEGPPYQIRIHFDPQGRVVDVSPPHPVP